MADDVLRNGERGEDIRRLQENLHERGYTGRDGRPLALDGNFGANTEHALRDYQRDNGLKVDGIAGPQTLGALAGQQAERSDAGSRLDRLMAGQVDPAAKEAWERDVAANRQRAAEAQDQDIQLQAEQQAQAGHGR
ncbi:peptidoglycan-binding protein [Lysobacter sp. TLK-CK17T]|uniref:Peptidoglycan-binding protein n=2 Tax=Marilutibacter chinensis TaxID=2912247 RepID=A0ABS9HU10_9GAMM|nr:peptidoglycan-binding domain-containing protein [Lysobacter chinensis]MCF7221657.1 peptidoglycan-binding protein [Lysobacter chinensis]